MSKFKMKSIYCSTLKNAGHFGFLTQNAMSKIISDYTTICPVNPRIDTENTNMPLMSGMISIYHLTLDKWRPSWIVYIRRHCVGYTLKPYNRHEKHECASIVLQMISLYSLTLDK